MFLNELNSVDGDDKRFSIVQGFLLALKTESASIHPVSAKEMAAVMERMDNK